MIPLRPKYAGEFTTFQDWVNTATRKIAVGEFEAKPMCVDTLGRRCHQGGDFMRARDEGTFPVRYFWEMEPDG